MDEIEVFAKIFAKHGSDKSGYHTYERVYGSLFKNRLLVKNVLEVGIHLGASLRAWKDLFSNANIIGLDNNIERFFSEERITSMYLDQSIKQTFIDFKSIIGEIKFDLIVDDGCHYPEETKVTFAQLLPLLNVGGWFVVEDIPQDSEHQWVDIAKKLHDNYFYKFYNMNDIAKTNGDDNIALAVKRLS